MKNITKIAVTGGPCAGKTKAIKWIAERFAEYGYGIIVVPESATVLINGGVAPWTCDKVQTFQRCVLRLQIDSEKIFQSAALTMPEENILIICDRGAMDCKAYLTEEEFEEILVATGVTEEDIIRNYDAVFHLVSTAKGRPEHYSNRSNAARTESVERAAELDDRTLKVWAQHPRLKVIETKSNMQEKMASLESEIKEMLNL